MILPVLFPTVLLLQQTQTTPTKEAPQAPPFQKEIQAFKDADKKQMPAKNQILLIGSSTFTNWKDVNDYFPNKQILNRAFGGSSLPDLIRYADDLLDPYQPRQVVIYCGENDIAGDSKLSANDVYNRFVKFYRILRKKLPTTPVLYVSAKPSWSRWHLRAKFLSLNNWIREFASKEPNTDYVDTWSVMLTPQGVPDQSIFNKDELHMNASGYKRWVPVLEPKLK